MLGDLLGRGGMAEVFAGHAVGDHGFQKPVAIKRLLPELANDEVFVERLIEEAKLLVGMQHGNIVSVLDLAREGDDVFLVMEFVDGPSLRQLIKARGTRGLSLGVATYIVQSAAAGLEFAHARPGGAIIHADISPSNLLLTTSGEVRVADFGIARREGLGHGVVEGKWAYMAPEQARGEPLTPRSDVFALGVVMYELLTGQHPFGRAVTANERDEQIQVIPPRVVKPSIPPGLDAICMRALAHSARDRYGRMQQLIDALVEERFGNGYREGASDLAQAIREVALKTDPASPRTMHTDRPVTIVTRSLLREVTPARRPSQPPGQFAAPEQLPPEQLSQAALAPTSDLFPAVPTSAATRVLDAVPDVFPVPALAQTAPQLPEPPPADAFPAVPSSGAQTVARMVDQLALAQVAHAAAAMLAAPQMANPMVSALSSPLAQGLASGLRADGTPMPPFRVSQADMRGEELASVVGGHTLTGHVPGIAIEARGHRWTIAVLGVAALIGVGAAVAIQLHPSAPPALADAVVASRAVEDIAARTARPETGHSDDSDSAPRAVAPRPVQPTIPESPVRPTLQDMAPVAQPASAHAGEPAAADRAGDGRADGGKPADASGDASTNAARSSAPHSGDARPADAHTSDARGSEPRSGDTRGSDARPGAKSGEGRSSDARPRGAKSGEGRNSEAPPAEAESADGRNSDGRSSDLRSNDARDSDIRGSDLRFGGARSGDAKSSDARGGSARPSDARPSETRTRDAKPRDTRSGDGRGSDSSDDARPASRRTAERSDDSKSDSRGKRTASRDGKRKASPGILYVEARPWSWVTVDVETKETPARFYLPPGVHIVKLYNEENGLTKYEKVVVESDKMQKLNEDMAQ